MPGTKQQAAIRVAVVGSGSMGRNHVRVYDGLKNVELVGIYEVNDTAAEAVVKQFGCRRFSSLEEVAASVDAVSICTPSVTHHEVGVYFLSRGIHCLIEKPLATIEAHCQELIKLAKGSGAVLLVGHIERFNPAVQQVFALLERGVTVRAIEARRLSSVGQRIKDVDVVADLMVHDLDIVAALVPQAVVDVAAAGVYMYSPDQGDHVTALLRFEGGAIATVTASRITQYTVRELSVVTDLGVIAVNYMDQSVEVFQSDNVRLKTGRQAEFGEYALDIAMERIVVRRMEPLQIELTHFVDCIRNGTAPIVSGEQALQALRLVWRVHTNIREQAGASRREGAI